MSRCAHDGCECETSYQYLGKDWCDNHVPVYGRTTTFKIVRCRHPGCLNAIDRADGFGVFWCRVHAPPMIYTPGDRPRGGESGREADHYDAGREAHAIAGKLVQGDRRETHGDFLQNFRAIAAIWTGYLAARFPDAGIVLTPLDASHLMQQMKVARTLNGRHNPDDYVDNLGYGIISAGLAKVLWAEPEK